MTSEILIMNKNAIAMAADSAVTVGNSKTYNGVNKLFMLSNDPPMGVMIFGSANFENIPLETLIKEYRKITNFKENNDIISIKNNFLDYLGKNTPNTDFSREMKSGLRVFKKFIVPKIAGMDIDDLKTFLETPPQGIPSFLEKYQNVIDQFDEEFKQMIPTHIPLEYHEDIINKLKNIYVNSIIRMGTGIVIAGFNEIDMFPSVVNFNIVLNNHGKIEIIEYNELLNHQGNSIIPFAQKDVIDTFLTGIDNSIGDSLIYYFKNFINGYIEELRVEFSNNNKIKNKALLATNQILDNFDKTSNKRVNEFKKNIIKIKKDFTNPILDSVGALPKEELANMSESLIHITSLKRKVDSNLETVGGDIDVAIISKGDGFIWKKRKHYFDKELNPQFFDRK